jgi:outer membrane protein
MAMIEVKKMRLKAFAWLALGLASGAAVADDLLTVYREGLQSDPVFAAARSSYEATKEKLPQGRALFLPNVNVTGNVNGNVADYRYLNVPAGQNTPPAGNANWGSWGAGVNITQPLLHLQNNAVYDQATILVAQAESQLAFAGQDLMIRVAQTYFDVLLAEYELDTVKAQKVATAEQLAQRRRITHQSSPPAASSTSASTSCRSARIGCAASNALRASSAMSGSVFDAVSTMRSSRVTASTN